ncbi:MAG: hypothetical protein ACFE9S_20350, partial [Candidatus Hermodarchaeota archaeon]
LVWIVLQLIVAIFLLNKMIKTKTYNILPLILFFFTNSVRILFSIPSIFPTLTIIYLILNELLAIWLVIFTKLTFFKYKKSPFKIFLIILITINSIDFIIRLIFQITIPLTFYLDDSFVIYYFVVLILFSISFLSSHLWLGITAIKYYNSIKSLNIEPWVKKRYQIIGLSSIIYIFSLFIYYLFPSRLIDYFAFPYLIYGFIILGFTIFYSLCAFIAWIMPKPLKKYFNKGFERPPDKEYSENELMEIIKNELSKEK